MHKVEFWSDHIDAPNVIFRNLSDATIERRCREALGAHDGDGDIWAMRTTIDRKQWKTKTFCFIKQDGEIFADPELRCENGEI